MAGMLLNNILYFFDIYFLSYILDFLIGNSIITTILLLVCSYVFHFCTWYRLIVICNIINVGIAIADAIYTLPLTDIQLLSLYHFIAAIFIIIATINHIKSNHERLKVKNAKKSS